MPQQLESDIEEKVRNFSGTLATATGEIGSGFVAEIDANNVATIITNQHVIRAGDGQPITVTLRDAATQEYFTVEATLKNVDAKNVDAATISADLSTATPISPNSAISGIPKPEVATFADAQIGETVFAAGKPYDAAGIEIKSFKTDFIIGGEAGQKGLEQGYNIGYHDDAYAKGEKSEPDAIIKGMSGGATVNEKGEVIGINGRHAYPVWEVPYEPDVEKLFADSNFEKEGVDAQNPKFDTLQKKLDSYNASIHPENLLEEFPELRSVITAKRPEAPLTLSDNFTPDEAISSEKPQQATPEPKPQKETQASAAPYSKDVIDGLRDSQIDLQSGQWQTTTEGHNQVVNNIEQIIDDSHTKPHFEPAAATAQDAAFILRVQNFLGMAGAEATGEIDTATLDKLTEFREKYSVASNATIITNEDVNMMNALQSARDIDKGSDKLSFTDTDFASVASSPIYNTAQTLQESKNAGTALF